MGALLIDKANAAYDELSEFYASDFAALEARNEGWFICNGCGVTVSATAGKLDLAAGVDFMGTTELGIAAQTAQPGTLSGIATTVGAGSNGVHTNTFAGAGSLTVASTGGGAPASGQVAIINGGVIQTVVSYTSITDATHFGGCTQVAGWNDYTLVTGDTVTIINNDLTLRRWAAVEVDNAGAYQLNLGTAAASPGPVKPALSANRVVKYWLLLLPTTNNTSALQMDELHSVANSKSKLMDARQIMRYRPGRLLFTDTANTVAMNPTTTTPLLAANFSLPLKSMSVGDVFVVKAFGSAKIVTSASTLTLTPAPASSVAAYTTTAALAAHATNSHRWWLEITYIVVSIGSGTAAVMNVGVKMGFSDVATNSPAIEVEGCDGGGPSAGFNSDAAVVFSLNCAIGTGNASSSVTCRGYEIWKFPVQT